MHILLRSFLIIFALSWVNLQAWAQSPCTNDFIRITPACINSFAKPFNSKPITLTNELKDSIYFYKTPGGDFGKLKVLGTTINKFECTLFLEAMTYGNNRSFIPNSSISIGVKHNHWLRCRNCFL